MSKISDEYFGPKLVFDHFMAITKLSHPSRDELNPEKGDEDPLRKYVADCASKIDKVQTVFYHPDAKAAGERVIVLRRPGLGNYSGAPQVTLQAHMDMVCYPKNDIFPLKAFDYEIKGERWIKAGDQASVSEPDKGTTLGADDGIGVATALALLQDESLKDYPLECLFTVQEETNMGGAMGFDRDLLIGRRYINLDAEDAQTIIYGSAGGGDVRYEGTVERSDMEDNFVAMKVSIAGLRGGHSGININKGRLNSIKALTEILISLNGRITNLDAAIEEVAAYDLHLVSMKREEETRLNSIPSNASAVVVIPQDKRESFERNFAARCTALKALYQPEEDKFGWQVCWLGGLSDKPLSRISTDVLLCLLHQIPHGVISMIPEKDNVGLVETSTNLAGIDIAQDRAIIRASNRSSSEASMTALKNMQRSIADCFHYNVTYSEGYPSWQPNDSSELLAVAKEVYKGIYSEGWNATVIHAGLECSYVAQKYRDDSQKMDCISIGPTIVDPHSGGERLKASTVEKFYETVTQIIRRLYRR